MQQLHLSVRCIITCWPDFSPHFGALFAISLIRSPSSLPCLLTSLQTPALETLSPPLRPTDLWLLPHVTDSVEYTPSFNPIALKDSALSTHKPIEVRGPGGKATIVHAQYNTPISMYSQDAIMDAIAGQSQAKGHERWGHTTKLIPSPHFILSPPTHCSHINQTRPLPKPTGLVHQIIKTFILSHLLLDCFGFICPK